MKETALLHSMAMLLQEMLERNEISETVFKKKIHEMTNHCIDMSKHHESKMNQYDRLKNTLDSLYCMDNKVKQLAY